MSLLEGKRGLVVGIANEHSIAAGCGHAFTREGAELAVTYLNDISRAHVSHFDHGQRRKTDSSV